MIRAKEVMIRPCPRAASSVGWVLPLVLVQQTAAAEPELGTVEVIGQRVPVALSRTTEVVAAEQLAVWHRDDLSQALELVPGLATVNLGQRRERLLTLRGFDSRQVPLFIDGVPVYVPYDGNVDLARFGVEYVSEIRVGKSLASLLYGPNIMGGAINVVSRRPTEPFSARARLSTELDGQGGHNLTRAAAGLSAASDRWYGSINVSGVESDGYRLPGSFTPVVNREDGGRRDHAGSSDQLYVLRLGFTPDEANEYGFTWYRQEGEKQDPPYAGTQGQARFWEWPYWNKQSFSLTSRNAVTERGTVRLRAYYDTFENSLDAWTNLAHTAWMFLGSRYDDYTRGYGGDFEWRWNGSAVTRLAAHYKKDVHRDQQQTPALPRVQLAASTIDFAIEQEWIVNPAFSLTPSYQYVVQKGNTVWVYSNNQYTPVRVEEATAHDAQLVGVWHASENGSFLAGVSHKTRFPALKERFSGGLGRVAPNPGLSPEDANHFELGYEHQGEGWTARLTVYQANLGDAIASVPVAPSNCYAPSGNPPCSQLQNIGRQRNRGLELSGSWQAADTLRLDAQTSMVDRDNLSSPEVLPTNLPRWRHRVAVNWQLRPNWRASVDVQRETKRFSSTDGARVAEAFTLANAFLRFTPYRGWGAELGVRNLTNELYAYEEGYYESGRSWLLQLDWRL